MRITNEKLAGALKKAVILREHLRHCPGPQQPALRVMDLHYVVQEVYGLKIDMLQVAFAGVYLKGKVERYADDRARVLVRANLANTEKRWVAVKELCHVVIDQPEDWSLDGGDTINGLLQETLLFLENGEGHQQPSVPLQSEILAMFAASELVYPTEYQEADLAKLDAGEKTISAIALEHDMPPYVIQQALSYRAVKAQLWGAIGD